MTWPSETGGSQPTKTWDNVPNTCLDSMGTPRRVSKDITHYTGTLEEPPSVSSMETES